MSEPDDDRSGPDGPDAEASRERDSSPDPELTRATQAPRTFSLERRAAPGLYAVGWVGTFVGLVLVAIGLLGGPGPLFVAGLAVLALGLLAASGAQALERARRPGLTYRGPSPWLVFAAVIPLTLVLQVLVIALLRVVGVELSLPVLSAVLLALTALVYATVVRLLVAGTGALTWPEMGLGGPRRRLVEDLVFGAAFALPVLFVAGLLVAFLSQFLALPPSPLPEAIGTVDILANLVSAAIIAPIGEELFFRGYATTAWARSYGRDRAIVIGAVFFALAHVITIGDTDAGRAIQAAVVAFAVRVPVGLVLGWLFLTRRSLAASIGLHATYNAIPVLLLAFSGSRPPL